MGGFKSLKPFLKNLRFSPLSINDIRVLAGIVDSLKIFKFNEATSVFVKNVETFSNYLFAYVVHGPADGADEFIIIYLVVAVVVEIVK